MLGQGEVSGGPVVSLMANLRQGGEEHATAADLTAYLLPQSLGVAKPCENLSKRDGGHKDISFFS